MHMFQSATIKLTAWYLGIIMTISLLFSAAIYQINFHEVSIRLENLQQSLSDANSPFAKNSALRQAQVDQAAIQLLNALAVINFVVFVAGGAASYFLARRTLRPIEEAHEAQSRFTSDASHELRTPLTAMKTEIEVTLRNPSLDATEAREQLESNLEEIEKLIQLSDMLLNLSRLDYRRLETRRVVLEPVLTQALKRHARLRSRFKLSLRKGIAAYGDDDAIEELMTILIDNALKYSTPNSRITIKLFQKRGMAGFSICNRGKQIDPADLPHIFKRFYRADSSRTKNGQSGYGLGLSIAKKIVDLHGGEIEAQSNSKETTFTFYLPMKSRTLQGENAQA